MGERDERRYAESTHKPLDSVNDFISDSLRVAHTNNYHTGQVSTLEPQVRRGVTHS